jgi:hypothetical protein
MSSELTAEVRRNNWQFLIHKLQQSEVHAAVVKRFAEASDAELRRVLRYHDDPVSDPDEIRFRALIDLWLGQAGLIYLAWLCGYIPDPAAMPDAGLPREILATPALRQYYEEHYPIAIQWLFLLQLEGRLKLACETSVSGAGAFERFSILYERFRDDQDLHVFLNLLDGFEYGRTNTQSVVESFKDPERVALALARRADQITYLDRGIVGMVRFLTFCHDLDRLLELCAGMPVVQSAFWFFYAYWFHEYSDVAEKSMEAIDNAVKAAESAGSDSIVEHEKWRLMLQRLTGGEFARALIAEVERAGAAGDTRVAAWRRRFQPYTQPPTMNVLRLVKSERETPHPDADRIVQCGNAIRHMYTVQMFSEKLAPAIHQGYRDDLPEHQRGGLYDRPYEELADEGKAANLKAAMRIPEILKLIGYGLQPGESTPSEEQEIADRLQRNMEALANAEHLGWMEQRLIAGWSYGPQRDDNSRKHHLLVPYADLPDFEKEKDRQTIRRYPAYARMAGLKIVPMPTISAEDRG